MSTDPWLVQFEARRKAKEEGERTFPILGETLTVKASVAPEVIFAFSDLQSRWGAYLERVAEFEKAHPDEPIPTDSGVENEEMLVVSEGAIRSCLTPESLDAWERLRDPERPDPLGLFEIYGLANFVLLKVTGLPTERPVGSSTGPQANGRSSKAASRSRAAGAKT